MSFSKLFFLAFLMYYLPFISSPPLKKSPLPDVKVRILFAKSNKSKLNTDLKRLIVVENEKLTALRKNITNIHIKSL